MKKLLILFTLFAYSHLLSQDSSNVGELKIINNHLIFQEVIEIPGKSKNILFNATRVWMSDIFIKSSEVIDYESKESGVISGRYTDKFIRGLSSYKRYYINLKVEIKDEKIRFTLLNIKNAKYGTPAELEFLTKKWQWKSSSYNTVKNFNKNANNMIQSLKLAIEDYSEETW